MVPSDHLDIKNFSDLQKFLEEQIPLSRNLQIQIINLNMDRSEMSFPLLPNRNHKGTAFGGSLYMASTLAAYALFFNGLRNQGFFTNDIVISSGEIKYLQPVTSDFFVECLWLPENRNVFFATLENKKKARVQIQGFVKSLNQVCALFFADFVAKL